MEIQKASGKGWVLFGSVDGNAAKWFERWFPSKERAAAYASRKGWSIKA